MMMKAICVVIFTVVILLAVLARWDLHTKYMDKSCVWHGQTAECN